MRARPISRSWKRATLVSVVAAIAAVVSVGLASASVPLGQGSFGALLDDFGAAGADFAQAVSEVPGLIGIGEAQKAESGIGGPYDSLDLKDEIVEGRTAFSKQFRVPGDERSRGSLISVGPIHYLAEDGGWRDIVLAFASGDDGRLWVTENFFRTSVSEVLGDEPMLTLRQEDGHKLTAGEAQSLLLEREDGTTSTLAEAVAGVRAEIPNKDRAVVRYPFALAGDLEVEVTPYGASTRIVLPASPVSPDVDASARLVWRETVRLGEGAAVWVDGEELLEGETLEGLRAVVISPDGEEIFYLRKPFATEVEPREALVDAAPSDVYQRGVLRLTKKADGVVCEKVFNASWFASEALRYPVEIDPNVSVPAKSCPLVGTPDSNEANSGVLWYRPGWAYTDDYMSLTQDPCTNSALCDEYSGDQFYADLYEASYGANSRLRIGVWDIETTAHSQMRAWVKFNISSTYMPHRYIEAVQVMRLYLYPLYNNNGGAMRVSYVDYNYCGQGGTGTTAPSSQWMYGKVWNGDNYTGLDYYAKSYSMVDLDPTDTGIADTIPVASDGSVAGLSPNHWWWANLICTTEGYTNSGQDLISDRANNRTYFVIGMSENGQSPTHDVQFEDGESSSATAPYLYVQYTVDCLSASDCTPSNCAHYMTCDNNRCVEHRDTTQCLISGNCYDNGDTRGTTGAETCYKCVSTGSAWTVWSANAGADCDDGEDCTYGDACGTTVGSCSGTNVWPSGWSESAQGGYEDCVDYDCNGGESLSWDVISGHCLINGDIGAGDPDPDEGPLGNCYDLADPNPANLCEVCRWGAGGAWTSDVWGTNWGWRLGLDICDDGNDYTELDNCTQETSGGTCGNGFVSATLPGDCNDDGRITAYCLGDPFECDEFPDWCASDNAAGSPDTCVYTPLPGACLINGQCYHNGDERPGYPCQICDSSTAASREVWTNRPNGSYARACQPCPGFSGSGDYTGLGDCVIGTQTCQNGDYGECSGYVCPVGPSETDCDGHDENCNGTVDEGMDSWCSSTYWGTFNDECQDPTCMGGAGCQFPLYPNKCLIGGQCYDDGENNPVNECQWCDVDGAGGTSAWTNKPSTMSCTDEGLTCTSDLCNGAGSCVHTVTSGCAIGGVCYVEGYELGECYECRNASDPWDWTYITNKPCDDGVACSFTDICGAGEAGCGGTLFQCDDGHDCTVDSCTGNPYNASTDDFQGALLPLGSGPGGGCTRIVPAGECFIEDGCYEVGQKPSDNLCIWCDAADQYAWSMVPVGEECSTDGLSCTEDECDGAGTCEHNLNSTSCLIEEPAGVFTCYVNEAPNPANVCQWCDVDGAGGTSAWTNKPYGMGCTGDGIDCTIDQCDGNGTCFWDVLYPDTCLIDGDCYNTGDSNVHFPEQPTDNECQWCYPSGPGGTTAWSNKPSTESCTGDVHDCTDDHCDGSGTCVHPLQDGFCLIGTCIDEGDRNPASLCDYCDTATATDVWTPMDYGTPCLGADIDSFSCTDDICDGASVCIHPIFAGSCLIESNCYVDSDENGQCEECQSGSSQTDWTYMTGKGCDDGDTCSHTDICGPGGMGSGPLFDGCVGTGYTCDDGKPCTENTCLGTTGGPGGGTPSGDCAFTRDPGYCIIDDTCYPQDTDNPANDCERCWPALDPYAWTVRPAGQGCKADTFGCTQDFCDGAGTCTHPVNVDSCLVANECWGDEADNVHDPALPGDNECEWCEPIVGATPCIVDADCPSGESCGFDSIDVTDPQAPILTMYCVQNALVWTNKPFNGDVTEHECAGDAYECTHDYCDGSGACIHPIDLGELGGDRMCLIDIEGTMTCLTEGDVNAANICEQCSPLRHQSEWSPRPEGTACYPDLFDCTDDVCGADNATCEHRIQSNTCLIDDGSGVLSCYADDEKKLGVGNDCLWCDPSLPTPCVPACEAGEVCDGGVCVAIGTKCDGDDICGRDEQRVWTNVPAGTACEDPWHYPCTTDQCDGAGTCDHIIQGDKCLIENQCWEDHDLNPDDHCEWCDAAHEQEIWQNSPVDTDCSLTGDDGFLCTDERCDGAGTCLHPIQVDKCLIDPGGGQECFDTHQQYSSNYCLWCEPTGDGGQTNWTAATPGIDCTVTGDDARDCTDNVCGGDAEAGTCVHPIHADSCLIANVCYENGDDNEANLCQWCNSLALQDDWSDKPQGMPCPDDTLGCTYDICSGGACTHPIRENDCLIDGVCFDEYDPSGLNECQWCDPGNDQEAFTNKPGPSVGTPVDPGSPAAWPAGWDGTTDRHTCANDIHGCTDDVCDGNGNCAHFITMSNCFIGGCLVEGTENGMCEECDPPEGQLDWTWQVGKACDDGETCTFNDVCTETPQECAGTDYGEDCNDGLVCTTDICNGDGTCTNNLIPGWCKILDTCYNTHQQNPSNPCQWCEPGADDEGWTVVPDDTESRECYLEACGLAVDPGTLNVGVCRAGLQWCSAGSWGACQGAVCPSEELCNALDDDCDSFVDETWTDDEGAPVGLRLGDTCDGDGDDDLCVTGGVYACRPDGADVYCDEGVQAYFKFEEGAGATTTPAQTIIGDGALTLPTWTAAGEGADGGFALAFDGLDDYVEVPSSELLDLADTLTLSAWIQLDSSSSVGWHVIMSKFDPAFPAEGYVLAVNVGQTAGLSAFLPPCGGWFSSYVDPEGDEWVHVAVTYDGILATLYMDGVELDTRACAGALAASASPFNIGGYGAAAPMAAPWNGLIDNVAVYDVPLDADAIKALARHGDFCDTFDNDCDGDVDEAFFPVVRTGDPNNYPAGAPDWAFKGDACDSGVDFDWCQNGVYECTADGLAVECGDEGLDSEIPETCNGLDDDCRDGLPIDEYDEDSDGFMVCENDCDDHSTLFNPAHPEMCDGFDNDCDGAIPVREQDIDGDTYMACMPGQETATGGYTEVDDCDDNNPLINRYRVEWCNGFDDDCDAMLDADDPDVQMFEVVSMTPYIQHGIEDDPATPEDEREPVTSVLRVYGKNFVDDDIHFDFGYGVVVDDIEVVSAGEILVTVTVGPPSLDPQGELIPGPHDVRIDLGTCSLVLEDGVDVIDPADVPSLSEWGIIILGLLLLGLGVVAVRRRQGFASIA